MPSSEEPNIASSGKRKRPASDRGSEETKKPRGRPRVQKQDETAADRRRTQIRLAQRAYRSRKETTISALKANTAELEKIIQQMSTTFIQFKDVAVSSGIGSLGPDLADALQGATELFVRLGSRASAISKEQSELMEQTSKAKSAPAQEQEQEQEPEPEPEPEEEEQAQQLVVHRPQDWGPTYPTPSPSISETDRKFDTGVWGYQVVYDASDDGSDLGGAVHSTASVQNGRHLSDAQMSVVDGLYQSVSGMSSTSSSPIGLFAPADNIISSLNLPQSPPLELAVPWTYSFQETSFARRLHRASLESAYHLLSQDKIRPERLRRAFRLSLLFDTKRGIAQKIAQVLRRGTMESLDFVDTPFMAIGGAGTHYPRTDAFGNVAKPPNTYAVQSIGPRHIGHLKHSSNGAIFPDIQLDLMDLLGDFFDPYDVEGYLRARGLWIDPASSFAEGDLSAPQPALGAPPAPQSPVPSYVTDELFQDANGGPSIYGGLDGLGAQDLPFDANYDSMSDSRTSLESPPPAWTIPAPPPLRTTHVTVDVQKLIDGLIKRAVCLGRAPGYRRTDVDVALSRAIVAF